MPSKYEILYEVQTLTRIEKHRKTNRLLKLNIAPPCAPFRIEGKPQHKPIVGNAVTPDDISIFCVCGFM